MKRFLSARSLVLGIGFMSGITIAGGRGADREVAQIAATKQAQVRAFARGLTNEVPREVWNFFDAVRADNWKTATNLSARLQNLSGRYSNPGRPGTISPALSTEIWPAISETIGVYEQFHDWDRKWLHRFANEIMASIPASSVYFGGTDPGRFIITALSESHTDGKPFFTLTQNQLVDAAYLEYLRKIYGKSLYVPTPEDVRKAFDEYLKDAQQRKKNGKLRPGEDVKMVGGRIQASGQAAVMEVNGLLVKAILEKNADRQFYLEESFPLDWMYPYLSPHGLILKLHHQPMAALGMIEVETNQVFWSKLVGELVGDWVNEQTTVEELCDFANRVYVRRDLKNFKGDAAFAGNREAQKTFSKLRSSVAGLYVWRADHAESPQQKEEMQKCAEVAFKQAFALCPYSPEAVFRYANFLNSLHRNADALFLAETARGIDSGNAEFKELVKRLSKEN